MKVKRLFSVMGLGLFAAVAAGVGAFALKEAKAEPVAAADDKMISVVIDLADAVGYTDFHRPEVHYYGTGIDKYADLHQLTGTCYTANLTYDSSTQTIENFQFLFKQTNDEDKWSNNIALTPSETNVYHFAFQNSWTGNKWDVAKDAWSGVPRVRGDGISDTNFVPNVATKSYSVSNLVLEKGNTYQIFYGKWSFGAIRQASVDAYLDAYSLNSFEVIEDGTYDIFAYNDYSDNGIFEIKKHQATDTVYIYYVLENGTPTNDYIYSWGGSEQFGSWPGTKVTSVAGVQEVTNNGIIRFQGGESTKLIYKIPVKTGYPVGDSQFKFNNNDTMETEARPISGHNAYWWSGDANGLAGYSLEFILQVEAIRNAAEDYSVCNISQDNATSLVNTYLSLGNEMQQTYIDCTTVYTHKRDGSGGNEYVSYRFVIEELAKIAHIELGSGSRVDLYSNYEKYNATTLIAIISVVAISSVLVVTLVLVKRRQHN